MVVSSPYQTPAMVNASMEFLSPIKSKSPFLTGKEASVSRTIKAQRKESAGLHLSAPRKFRILRSRVLEQSKQEATVEDAKEAFTRLALLGEGGSSYVFLIEDNLTQKRMVLKEYKRTSSRKALKEFLIGKSLQHESIVQYYSHQDNKIFMEYVESEKPACGFLTLAFKLARVIAYLHHNNVCHTDIKPKNVIVTKGCGIKLIDFGESMKQQLWKKGRTGTYGYMAP